MLINQLNRKYEDDDIESDYDETLSEPDLQEDLKSNPNGCAYGSPNQRNCITNQQVYNLLSNQTDFLKISKTIELQLQKPNEHMCTSIDLSMYQLEVCQFCI